MRVAKAQRKSKETDITINLNLDGGEVAVETGLGFFDHMLISFALHGGFGLNVRVKGDLEVDGHHTVEDTAIVLGRAFKAALGDKTGINRFGTAHVPMDEALAFATVDVSGRPYLVFDSEFAQEKVGDFDSCLCEEFFRALTFNAGITLHVSNPYGKNTHHKIEALFKAAARAISEAVSPKGQEALSTKGVID